MASTILEILGRKQSKNGVGGMSSIQARVLNNGAIIGEEKIDNYTLVEVSTNKEGERECKSLTDAKKKCYLLGAVERRYEVEGMADLLSDFYNAKGERGRLWILDQGVRFESSSIKLDSTVTEVKNGCYAHWSALDKKFLIHDGKHADYEASSIKLEVVEAKTDLSYDEDVHVVRFEVI